MQDEEYKKKLSKEQYHVLRESGTEAPFTGKLLDNKKDGMYHCAACNAELFKSDTKFESGSGWPSFSEAARNDAVKLIEDKTLGMTRTEVRCANCDSHLGHVFNDGPDPSGDRFCINSLSLDFTEQDPK